MTDSRAGGHAATNRKSVTWGDSDPTEDDWGANINAPQWDTYKRRHVEGQPPINIKRKRPEDDTRGPIVPTLDAKILEFENFVRANAQGLRAPGMRNRLILLGWELVSIG
ncbi:hypothetical protein PIIN_10090, partial [Serendipita indica DSM 11827]